MPYSVDEVYGIRNSGKYGTLKRTYNELFHVYGRMDFDKLVVPELVIAEDSNAGFQFFHKVCVENGHDCVSAGGKSNIFSTILDSRPVETLIVADGAAFGAEMDKIMKIVETNGKIHLYLPESFEWLILKSGLLEDKDLKDILKHPYNYVEGKILAGINPAYLQEKEKHSILQVMEGIKM